MEGLTSCVYAVSGCDAAKTEEEYESKWSYFTSHIPYILQRAVAPSWDLLQIWREKESVEDDTMIIKLSQFYYMALEPGLGVACINMLRQLIVSSQVYFSCCMLLCMQHVTHYSNSL